MGGVKCKGDIWEEWGGNEVGKRDDARGSWRKRLGMGYLVITRGSHLTDRLLEASGRRVEVEE